MKVRIKSGGLVLLLLLTAVLILCLGKNLVPTDVPVKTVPRLSGARSQEEGRLDPPPISNEKSTPVPGLSQPKAVADKSL